jgi:chitosanase
VVLTLAAVTAFAASVYAGIGVSEALAISDLSDPVKKDMAMRVVSSAENSSIDWQAQYSYIEDIGDGRGYTAGIIGFCSGTGDMFELVKAYTVKKPDNVLAKYLPALQVLAATGSDSHQGLDPDFAGDWVAAAQDPTFQEAQNSERDRVYFNPSVALAKQDGVRALGQFIYYDASVMHGHGGLVGIRKRALARAKPPAQGGDEAAYLNAFLDERVVELKKEDAHAGNVDRVETEQRKFLNEQNFDFDPPLDWRVNNENFHLG